MMIIYYDRHIDNGNPSDEHSQTGVGGPPSELHFLAGSAVVDIGGRR